MQDIIIALDAMGGDHGTKVTIPAALMALNAHPALRLILAGDPSAIDARLSQEAKRLGVKAYEPLVGRFTVQPASQTVAMDELPSRALRYKKDSSMRVAINLVKEGRAQACVSAGNTGALMATARFVLKTLPGISRPAIIATFPTHHPNRLTWMLDLGANVETDANHLYQFALMGSTFVKAQVDLGRHPRVGLLNVGVEAIKGNEQVKQADKLLAAHKTLNYVGFVEGDAIFSGDVDIVVCDGFVGNITLKACEAEAKLVKKYIKQLFEETYLSRLVGLCVRPILKRLAVKLNPGRRNGASLLGLKGVVIKSHGGADASALAHAIGEAVVQATCNIPQLIGAELTDLLEQN